MKIRFTFVLLAAALLFSCHSVSQTSGTLQTTPKYTFKKAEMPEISPCVKCFMSNAKRKYRRGNISFPACVAGSSEVTYLKLSVSKGSAEQKMVVSRGCLSDLNTITYAYCPSQDAGFDTNVITNPPTIQYQGKAVLTVNVHATYVTVTVVSGWDLYYETVNCPD